MSILERLDRDIQTLTLLILLNLTGTLTQSSSSLYSYLDILHHGIVNLIWTILSSGLNMNQKYFQGKVTTHQGVGCILK